MIHFHSTTKKIIIVFFTTALTMSGIFVSYAETLDDFFNYPYVGTFARETENGTEIFHTLESDLIYLEYPEVFSLGETENCPLVLYNSDNRTVTSDNSIKIYHDSRLIGSVSWIEQFVQSGGIDSFLSKALNIDPTVDHQLILSGSDDWILWYYLINDSDIIATIVIWSELGQIAIRNEIYTAIIDQTRDYGYIYISPITRDADFSSLESLTAFALYSLQMEASEADFFTTYETEHHQYLSYITETDESKIAFYCPVTPEDHLNWQISFIVSKETQIVDNAYNLREQIIQSFQVLR